MTQETKTQRSLLAGVLVCGLLLVGIAFTLDFRSAKTMQPTATFVPDVVGVTPIEPPRGVSDFTLPSSGGQPLAFSALQGKYTLLFFGYTHCTDVCPATLGEWVFIKKSLSDAAARVNFVFVSVDGQRDTPDVMRTYLNRFDSTFIGLSGDQATLARIGSDFGLYYKLNTDEGPNYSVDHSTQTYLFNPQELMTHIFSVDASPDAIVQTIQKLMAKENA